MTASSKQPRPWVDATATSVPDEPSQKRSCYAAWCAADTAASPSPATNGPPRRTPTPTGTVTTTAATMIPYAPAASTAAARSATSEPTPWTPSSLTRFAPPSCDPKSSWPANTPSPPDANTRRRDRRPATGPPRAQDRRRPRRASPPRRPLPSRPHRPRRAPPTQRRNRPAAPLPRKTVPIPHRTTSRPHQGQPDPLPHRGLRRTGRRRFRRLELRSTPKPVTPRRRRRPCKRLEHPDPTSDTPRRGPRCTRTPPQEQSPPGVKRRPFAFTP